MSYERSNGAVRVLSWSLAAVLISVVLVLIRVMPIGGPVIFSDEYDYAAWASAFHYGSQTPPALAPTLGGWLYLRLYGIVFAGAGPFLGKLRVLNAVISSLGAGALVSTLHTAEPSKRLNLAIVLSVGFVVALLGTYAAYFIPEAPYFTCVCLWLYILTKYVKAPSLLWALGTGVAGGIATMVKAHGVLILPATLVTFLLIGIQFEKGWRSCGANIAALVIGWFVCTTVIGLFLGNGSGLNPIGSFYSGLGLHTAEALGEGRGGAVAWLALQHVATLLIIIGMPLLICAWIALVSLFRPLRHGFSPALQFPAFALGCMLIGMMFVTVIFTVSVSGTGPFETLSRLHGRYYEHFAVLSACFGIIGSRSVLGRWPLWVRGLVFVFFVGLLGVAWWTLRGVGWQNPNDFAIAYALFAEPKGRLLALLLSVLSTFLALAWPKHSPTILACALSVWFGFNVTATEKLRWPIQEQAAGRVAAMVAADEAGASPRASVEIVGSSVTVPVYRAAFHLLNDRIGFALGSIVKSCDVDGRTPDWVIMVDGERDPCGYPESIRIGGASAAQRLGPSTAVALAGNKGRYSAKLAVIGQPAIATDGKDILVKVTVTNTGPTIFGSSSESHNVNLGAHSINAAGDVAVNDLARSHLPQIAPGRTAETTILLPITESLRHRVELLPVQEGVAWFDRWGTRPLIIGPFQLCVNPALGKVCDTSGKPLPKARPVQ